MTRQQVVLLAVQSSIFLTVVGFGLQATRDDSPVAKFIRRNGGPGVHHITFEVDDLDAALAELAQRGGRIAYQHTYAPGVTFEGCVWREAFIHPKDACGVLIHLAEKRPAG